jgi:hypothetical protein
MADLRVKDLTEAAVPGADYYLLTDSATDGVRKVKPINIVTPADIGAVPAGSLATVATSGAYSDLSGLPSLGALATKNNVAIADISAAGTPSIATALFGDGTWKTPAGGGDMAAIIYDPTNVNSNAFDGYPVASRTALKALDTTKFTSVYLTEADREGRFIWKTGDFTAALASDGFEGIYIKANAVPITAGCWVRRRKDYYYRMDWFGARTAADIKPIFDKVKLLAAGCTLRFGAATYTTSDTLSYNSVGNAPLTISGAGETLTQILMAGTGFAIQYYGGVGGGVEARGGGVHKLKISKTGGGTCSGIDIANVYRGIISHNDTSGCGNIGIRVTGRGAGDTDATAGTVITQNRCRDGVIGIQVRGDTSGSVVAAELEISRNNVDGNDSSGLWIACVDKIVLEHNTVTACGAAVGAGVNKRGGMFIEYFGGHVRNVIARYNEFGNSLAGASYNVMIDALIGGRFEFNRHIRNVGEGGVGAYLLGVAQTSMSITDVNFDHDYFAASGSDSYTLFAQGGTTMVYAQNTVTNPQFIVLGAGVTKYATTSMFLSIQDAVSATRYQIRTTAADGSSVFNRTNSDGAVVAYQRAGVTVGSHTVTSSGTTFNGTSDEALKVFSGEFDPSRAIEVIKSDPVREWDWIEAYGGKHDIGWGAQTSHAISPDLATPGGWWIDADGNRVPEGTPGASYWPWMMDKTARIPYLWASVSRLIDKIEQLEAEVLSLKNHEN